jgi:hypothetical protein
MSKTFNSIEDLWLYCEYCHICNDFCRDITISTGPTDNFRLVHAQKEDNILNIQCVYNKNFLVTYDIDCITNTFKIIGNDPNVKNIYLYFTMQSVCRKCNSTHACGTDLELNTLKESIISNIGLSSEGVYLLNTEDMYHITMLYDTSKMLVSKCFKDENNTIIDNNLVCYLPLVNLDFSNPHQAAHRIKTMLVFS